MIEFQIDRMIDRPIEVVFEQLVDLDGYRNWMEPS